MKIWVPKLETVDVVDMLKRKGKANIMVPGQWLLTTHDRRIVYVLTLTMKDGGTVGFGGNQYGIIIGTRTIGNSSISINISQFCDSAYDVMFDKSNYTVINKNDKFIVFKRKSKNNVYKINFSELTYHKVVRLLLVSDKKWLWPRRLRHANWRLIYKLSKLQLVRGLQNIDYHSDALCGACQKGKIVKSSFKSKDIISTSKTLELLHIDLFGPVSTASIYGSKYGLLIVDDYNRWIWVKFHMHIMCLVTSC